MISDHAAERSVIGSILLDGRRFADCDLSADDFTDPSCRAMWAAMCDLDRLGKPVDNPLIVKQWLSEHEMINVVGGNFGIAEFTSIVPSSVHARHYADTLRSMSIRRAMMSAGEMLSSVAVDISASTEQAIESAQATIYALGCDRVDRGPVSLADAMRAQWERIEKQLSDGRPTVGLTTGFIEIDRATTGMHPSELWVVAGRPSMGKSTFALNMIRKCAKLGSPVMMFSVEMSEDNVVRNLTSAESHVDGMRLRRCELNQDELGRIVGASEKLASIPVYIDDTPAISISKVRARARKLKSQTGLSAVFIDYLQYVRGTERGQSREQEVSEVSRGLKSMSKELQIPVVALAQLNRNTQGRKDPTPLLSDLRESGAIEQDADVVILLHRPEYYDANAKPGVMETIIAKQRNGPTGSIDVTYIGNQFRIENLSEANNV